MLRVGGGKCVTQSVKESSLPPEESVTLMTPSSVSCGVPENVKFEKESQEGRSEVTVTESFNRPKVFGEMDQEYGWPTRAMRGNWSLTGYGTSSDDVADDKEGKNIKNKKERMGIVYMAE